jgi:cytochrome c oxidase assembly protein subunit 15
MTDTPSTDSPWLTRFAVLTAAATLFLIGIGGLVTSHGVGMSVPDWPTTYGYNMFFFPISQWMGGVFYEHSHRLAASVVGMLTALLAGWIWVRHTPSPTRWVGLGWIAVGLGLVGVRTKTMFMMLALAAMGVILLSFWRARKDPQPIRWWALIAFSTVLIQGVLGGLRVTELQDALGIFHAALAQVFFVLLCAMALVSSRWWRSAPKLAIYDGKRLRYLYGLATAMILFQLILGAAMRHQHAGLAIPDFPLAYGKVWPATDAPSVIYYNQTRMETQALNPITAFQINLQMMHRISALFIFVSVICAAVFTQRQLGWNALLTKLSLVWGCLMVSQVALGAATIWTNKSADIATAHVAVGALTLMVGSLALLVAHRSQLAAREAETPMWSMQPKGHEINLPA